MGVAARASCDFLFAQKATGHAKPSTRKILADPRAFHAMDRKRCG
jgi:hypothetical protein